MAIFYFKYEGNSYKALASIINCNGKVSCNLTSVVNSLSREPATLIGFKPGPVSQNNIPLRQAINKGLSEYVKNYPLDRG